MMVNAIVVSAIVMSVIMIYKYVGVSINMIMICDAC